MDDDFFDPNSVEVSLTAEEDPNASHRLESKFEDPLSLLTIGSSDETAIPNLSSDAGIAINQEASHAVQELILGISDEPSQPKENTPVPQETTDPTIGLATGAAEGVETEYLGAKVRLYQEVQDLILCDYSFDLLVEKGLQALMRSVSAQAGSILEMDYGRGDFFFRASRGGASDKVKSFRVPAKQGIVGFVSESGQALLINDLQDDERQLKSISVAVGFEARSCMAVPLLLGGKLYGVVEVFNRLGTIYFQEKDKALLMDGAVAFAKALEVRFYLAEVLSRKAS